MEISTASWARPKREFFIRTLRAPSNMDSALAESHVAKKRLLLKNNGVFVLKLALRSFFLGTVASLQ